MGTHRAHIVALLACALCALSCALGASNALGKASTPIKCSKLAKGRTCAPGNRYCRKRKGKKRKCITIPTLVCGHLQHIPDLNARTVAYKYRFKLGNSDKEKVVTATWSEKYQRVMQDEPTPLIARLAIVGWERDHDANIDPADREICAVGDPRLITETSFGQPDRIPDWVQLRTRDNEKIDFDALEPYSTAEHQAALDAVNRHADQLGIGTTTPDMDYSDTCPPIEGNPGADPLWCLGT